MINRLIREIWSEEDNEYWWVGPTIAACIFIHFMIIISLYVL